MNYKHQLLGLIYKLLASLSPDLAERYHRPSKYKPYTFSDLWIRGSKVEGNKLLIKRHARINFTFSSLVDELSEALIKGFSKFGAEIDNCKFELMSFKIPEVTLSTRERFIALSPIVVSRPVIRNGKVYHEFLDPRGQSFWENLVKNLKKRYEAFFGKSPGEVDVRPDEDYLNRRRTSKLIEFKGTYIKAHVVPFEIEGDKSLIELGYYGGVGERTGQGFGCVEVKR